MTDQPLTPALAPPEGPGPRAMVRRVAGEPVAALLVQRALVMEVAHPKVAAAVSDHSSFRSQPLRRAWATADAAARLVFGDDRAAVATVARIRRTHDRVHGEMIEGDAYTAHDPELLCWVWATLVDTAELAFTRWVRPFGDGEADAFYREMRDLARFVGVPDAMLPATNAEHRAYVERMLNGPVLGSTPATKTLARQVLWFRHVLVPPAVVRLERSLALATLDPRLLERLDLRASTLDTLVGRSWDAALRASYRYLPAPRLTPLPVYLRMRALTTDALALLGRVGGGRSYTASA